MNNLQGYVTASLLEIDPLSVQASPRKTQHSQTTTNASHQVADFGVALRAEVSSSLPLDSAAAALPRMRGHLPKEHSWAQLPKVKVKV
jgi:hypothetical protein